MGATLGPAAPIAVDQPVLSVPLTVQDRCDRCGAQAYVRVVVTAGNLEMLFCAHHFEKNAAALAGCSVVVTDDRHSLRTRAS